MLERLKVLKKIKIINQLENEMKLISSQEKEINHIIFKLAII